MLYCSVLFLTTQTLSVVPPPDCDTARGLVAVPFVFRSDAIRKRKAWERSWDAAATRFRDFLLESAHSAGATRVDDETAAARYLAHHFGFGVHF